MTEAQRHMLRAPQALLCVHCGEQLVADGEGQAAIDDLLNYRAPRHMRIYHSKDDPSQRLAQETDRCR